MSNTLTKFPLVQYSGMDYDTVVEDIKNIITNNPKWKEKWGNFYDADAGVVLTDLMAYIADNLSARVDYAVNENYISTASQDKNKLRILKLINYSPSLATAASLKVKLELSSTSNLDGNKLVFTKERNSTDSIIERASKIMKISALDTYGDTIYFEAIPYNKTTSKYEYFSEFSVDTNISSASYTLDNSGDYITLHQGETKQTYFYSDESDGVSFNLSDTNIIEGSVRIFDRSTMEEFLCVDSFIQKEALSEKYSIPYTLSINEDGTMKISFANSKILTSTTRRFQAGNTIDVFYRVGGGEIGNIPTGFLNKTISVPLYNGGTSSVTIINETVGSGGTEAETADEAVVNGPLSIRTAEKAVTPEDYDIIINKYGKILKVKTYSSSNAPSTFKTKYGRYLNPQEIFSFLIFNKEHSSVPASKYNYFPWIELEKENRFNEQYTFSDSSFNNAIVTPVLNKKLTLFQDSAEPKLFTNCMALDLSSEIGDSLFVLNDEGVSIPNEDLLLKIQKETSDAYYFTNIPFSIFNDYDFTTGKYTKNDASFDVSTSKASYLSSVVNNRTITVNTQAKYLSNKWTEAGTAIEIKSYGNIGLVLDDKGIITIDLKANLTAGELAKDKIYRYLSNTAQAIPEGYVWKGVEAEAIYRSGIIETINSQIVANAASVGSLYNESTSIQYIGAGKESVLSTISSFEALITDVANFEVTMTCDINGSTYRFIFSDERFTLAKELITDVAIKAAAAPTNIAGITAMIQYELINGVSKYEGGTWSSTLYVLNTDFGFKYDLVKRYMPSGENSEYDYTASIDMMFYTKTVNGFKSSTEKYIDIEHTKIGELPSLIHSLADVSEQTYATLSFVPAVIIAASYENLTSYIRKSVINNTGATVNADYLQIKSPLTGSASSIYFVSVTSSKDFMSSFYDVSYINDAGSIDPDYSITSNKATGVKKITLLTGDQSVGYCDGETIDPYPAGTIIYEHNCINTTIDFPSSVYCTYKKDNNSEIELGSTYENFYFTGDTETDNQYKSSVSGLLGFARKTITDDEGNEEEIVDTDKSNYIIKFSNTLQDTTSIYAIESEVDAIPVGKISIPTAEIGNLSLVSGMASKLIFSVDDMITPVTLQGINGSTSSTSVLEAIQSLIDNRVVNESEVRNYSNFTNDICKYDYETRKVIRFGNVAKDGTGVVKFYKDATATDAENQALYKAVFGTNLTNPELYNLYGIDIASEDRFYNVLDPNEYSFYPGGTSGTIEFVYKAMVNNTARYGDYYITKESTFSGNVETVKYILTKTEKSTFQDKPFYIHFVNDRALEKNVDGTYYSTEEKVLKEYLTDYTISGVENTFLIPYFKTFDIKATIYYNSSYSKTEISSAITTKITNNYNIENMSIGQKVKKSSIYKDIMTVPGVTGVDISYFGLDATNSSTNVSNEITVDFDEILVIHEDTYETGGTKIRGAIFTYEKDGN